MLDVLFTPKKIGNCEIPNRLVVPAMVTNVCNPDGTLTERFIKYHEEKAKGGWGLIIVEDYGVTESAKGYAYIPGFYNDDQIAENIKLTNTVHEYGSKIFCQIYHSGKQKMPDAPGECGAPSAIKDPMAMNMPREMTVEEIHNVVKAFGEAAARAKKAGFDGIEIHAGHGYLIAQFLSGFINKRTDEYGGCFANRIRFFDEVYAEVRKKVGADYPVIVRFSVNEYITGGRTECESYALARHFDELGVDAIHVTNGCYASEPNHQVISSMFAVNGMNADAAAQIRELVSCPVITVNKINEPMMADTVLKMGKADFIAVGRGSLADPYFPAKAKEGRLDEINHCIGCLQGCLGETFKGNFTYLVNPRVTREYENDLSKAETGKKVMIVGAGPAGLMAARTAAIRGHEVDVYDRDTHFGGAFRSASYPMGKGILATVISSYRAQCEKLGVKFHMGCDVNEELITEVKPDSIILATGSRPFTPPIDGIKDREILTAEDVLLGNVDVPQGPVVVCGGGEVGGETAEFISQTNRDVTILEMRPNILVEMFPWNRVPTMERLYKQQVKIITNATVSKIASDAVIYKDQNGQEVEIPAATVVSAFGYRNYNPLEEVAKKHCADVHVIGSAVKAGNALTAIREGYDTGLAL